VYVGEVGLYVPWCQFSFLAGKLEERVREVRGGSESEWCER
jgi:hypothetical protein